MGIIERKERDKQEMRLKILETAQQIFIEEGFEKASIRAIADRIEYSPATIYLYFKDKNELFFSVHEMGFEKLILEMTIAIEGITDPIEELRARGFAYMKFAFQNPEMYDLMFIQNAPMESIKESSVWTCGHQCFELLCQTIQKCIDQNYIRFDDIYIASMSIWSFMHGLVSLKIRNRFQKFGEAHVNELMKSSVEQMIAIISK
ncbi:TetR family transcriptional regulator [Arcicella aurantiaca]|uniref:TetR family transcriptional regulator n=1 Tax=Arcicella aurantiaca TaxID=591202 RepID=A0A316DPK4_9BACT|nr:TetR/AcrR family transcriptional regulator [Arcicella aurantiaca]PWK19438.1 TetR family transcriptional regulator [Arcicella aurantiaca]